MEDARIAAAEADGEVVAVEYEVPAGVTEVRVPWPTWCAICGIGAWVNPTDDHENWLGHPWTPRNVPGRVSISEAVKLGL